MTPTELAALLLSDEEMRCVLQAIAELRLPDCWLAAGAVRNAMWNHLSGRPFFDRETDLDVVKRHPFSVQFL
ncbi:MULTISPECIES: nucleotidyltransferase family protein [unclassified Streptococcus]|uniref:nucleotidyltransferase family protein n=1 Tax=unclassified Streptococcus TaxID=2608887 RepID=UPI00359EBB76